MVKDAISVKETNGKRLLYITYINNPLFSWIRQPTLIIYSFILLGTQSYEILSASVNYESVGQIVELDNKADEDAFKKLIEKLNESETITGVYHNCSMEI